MYRKICLFMHINNILSLLYFQYRQNIENSADGIDNSPLFANSDRDGILPVEVSNIAHEGQANGSGRSEDSRLSRCAQYICVF